ncbi:MAG TPA: tetratricopeptide repeat protein [Bryobacteraceae bacterium]|nr:tetratricopeptide repeat protein [Bryobacteraceae bacterium]
MSMRRWILAASAATVMWAAASEVQEAKKLIAAKKYDDAIVALEKAQKVQPKSPEVKKAFAEAYVGQGDTFMYNEALPPRMKYPQALKSYRKALEYDKTHKQALAQIKTIEDIYKSMGRPVPQ